MVVPSVLKCSKISLEHCLTDNEGPNWRTAPEGEAEDATRPATAKSKRVNGSPLLEAAEEVQRSAHRPAGLGGGRAGSSLPAWGCQE